MATDVTQEASSPSRPPPEKMADTENQESQKRVFNILTRDELQQKDFSSNKIRTYKYTLVPIFLDFFLWKMLFEQFQRKANIYFLIIGCLQLVPGLSPTGRYTTISTLVAVLIFTFIKTGYEDSGRHRKDAEINSRKAFVLRTKDDTDWVEVQYTEIKVGDVIRVSNMADEEGKKQNDLPCDIMIVTTSDPDGVAYVETANLDGETNLKLRRALPQTTIAAGLEDHMVAKAAAIKFANIKMETERPNNSLYTFTGNMFLPDAPPLRVGPEQMMYRGCVLRKVHWVVGIVIFTGPETKIMMNARKPPHKTSSVENLVNTLLLVILLLQLVMCSIGAIGLASSDSNVWYLGSAATRNISEEAALGFITFAILFNNLIPISLYVSIEFVKFMQGRMMEQDLCMYFEPKDMPAGARTTDINEELGQVSYVFSDKTGTLTRNVMTFLKFCIDGENFGEGTTEIGRAANKRKGIKFEDPRTEEVIHSDNPFWDDRINDSKWLGHEKAEKMRDLFVLLGVCHTVVVDNGKYEAESPDEEALVKAARHFGFSFVNRTTEQIILESHTGTPESYDVLEIVEFNSDRKRMSMLVRMPEHTKGEPRVVKLFMKGADTVMFERLYPGQEEIVKKTQEKLSSYGDEGLRTLVVAERIIPEAEWKEWVEARKAARGIIGNDKEKEAKLDALAASIEVNMQLIGATAIEDKLQEGVPHCVDSLRQAGMKVWMLTGDKLETAINIGFACALLHDKMKQIQLDSSMSTEEVVESMKKELDNFKTFANSEDAPEMGVIIDGATLAKVLGEQHPGIKDLFVELTANCSSVVCCRVSPKQKADVVEMVRFRETTAVTLAIGDGANDVPMIQAAHVGIGISGMEGQQAANSADYAIGQFRYLHRLTLVHGRANYQRLCLLIRYFFYKNALVVLTQFWYIIFNLWTGKSLYENWTLAGYNVAFTAFPVLVVGIFNRDVLCTDHIHYNPSLYAPGLKSEALNLKVFCQWLLNAVYHSIIIFFAVAYGYEWGIGKLGVVLELDGVGLVMYAVCVVVVNVKLGLHINSFTWMEYITLAISVLGFFAFLAIYGSLPPSFTTTGYETLANIGFQVSPWIFFLGTIALTLARDFIWRYYEYNFVPVEKLPTIIKVQIKDDQDEFASVRVPMELSKKDPRKEGKEGKGGEGLDVNLFAQYDAEEEEINPSQDLLLGFLDKEIEDKFIYEHLGTLARYKIGVFICSVAATALVIATATPAGSDPLEVGTWGLFAAAAWICFGLLFFTTALKPHVHTVMCTMCAIGFSGMSIAHFVAAQRQPDTHPVTLGVILLGLLCVVRPPLLHAMHYVLISFLAYVIWYRVFRVPAWFASEFLVRFVELTIVAIVSFIQLYLSESFLRRTFVGMLQVEATSKAARLEESRALSLLGNVLPSALVREMRGKKLGLSDFSVCYEHASLLNSDIVKFTVFSSTKPPAHVVEMLNKMFTKFDRHAVHLGLEKIKTIGDAYICAAGIPIKDENHQQKILIMGLRMNNAIAELNQEGTVSLQPKDLDIRIRVGAATGAVRAGVIAMQKVAYDIFGHTAEESEYMEQTGRAARVQASAKLYEDTKHLFQYDIVVNSENDPKWPKTAHELGVTQYFVIEPADLMEDCPKVEGEIPLAPVHREDIYKFLEDDDELRKDTIKTYSSFQGEMNYCSVTFELEPAEMEFRNFFRSLANNRFISEAAQGTFLFLASGLLIALNVQDGISHWGTIISFVLALIHFIALLIRWYVNRKGDKKEDENKEEISQPGEVKLNEKDKKRKSVSVLSGGDADEVDDDAISDSVCSPMRAWATFSAFCAYALPLIVMLAILADRKGSGTITVFIVLASQIYVLSFLHMRIWFKIIVAIIHGCGVAACYWYMSIRDGLPLSKTAGDFFAIILCYVLCFVAASNAEISIRMSFAAAKRVNYQNAEVLSAIELCDKLLNNVLPRSIVSRLKAAPEKEIVDEVDGASVMFLYLDGLHIDEQGEVSQAVADFNEFLWVLDSLCVKHQVEKIKTSPFLIVSGCPEPNDVHARKLAVLARDVLTHLHRYCTKRGLHIKVKCGIHTGKVTAGVLGSSKFLYDIFGDTVNFASRLTSSAKPDTVQVSKITKEALEKEFEFEGPKQMELKGKGPQEVYLLKLDCPALKSIPVPNLVLPNDELLKTQSAATIDMLSASREVKKEEEGETTTTTTNPSAVPQEEPGGVEAPPS